MDALFFKPPLHRLMWLYLLLPALQKKKYKENMRLWWHLANLYGILKQYDTSISTYYLALTKKEGTLPLPQLSRFHFELAMLLSSFRKDHTEAQKHFEISDFLMSDFFQ